MARLGDYGIVQSASRIKAGEGLNEGKYKFFTSSAKQSKWLNEYQFDQPALIFGTGGVPSVHFCDTPFSTSTDCLVMFAKGNANLEVIYRYLSANMHLLAEGFHGIGLQHISKKFILDIEVPNVDADIQDTVVALANKIDMLIALRKEQLTALDQLVKSRFVELFGDMLLNPRGWSETRLDTIADIVSGITKGRKVKTSDLMEVPYMAVSNVKDGYIDWTTVKTIMVTQAEIEQYRLLPYDVLMTEGGDPDKLGRGAIIQEPPENCIHQNHIFRVRLDQTQIIPEFMEQYLKQQKAKRYFLGCAKQTTGIASINMTQLKALPVLIPPVELQNEYKLFVEQTDKSKLTIQRSLDELETLKKALMQKYFG